MITNSFSFLKYPIEGINQPSQVMFIPQVNNVLTDSSLIKLILIPIAIMNELIN